MTASRRWWQDVIASDWTAFSLPDDLARERYCALLAALEELSTRGPMSTLTEISERLRGVGFHDPLPEADLRASLDQLAKWGFTEPFRDYAAPVRNYQGMIIRQEAWALTRKGRGIVAAVHAAVLDAGRALQLPARLLDSVERTIRAVLEHAASPPEHGLLTADLGDIRTRIEELQRVTADFYAALAQLVQSDVTDDDLFGDNRDRVIEALRQFPREYERALRRVDAALSDLRTTGHTHVVSLAVNHAGLLDASAQQSWITERVRLLSDLEAWFHADGIVHRLIDSASGAVSTLLNAIDRRYSARLRGADLGADFRTLAHSLHRQSDDQHARAVYAAAFGDWPAWHAAVGPASEDVAHSTPASAGVSRHVIELTLREHERHGPPGGRPHKVTDTTAARQAALAHAAEQARARRRYTELLVTDGDVSLQHFAALPHDALVVLLKAIEVAVAQADPTSGIGHCDSDGAGVVVTVRLPDTSRTITVRFPHGTLRGPDLRVNIRSASASADAAVAAQSSPHVAGSNLVDETAAVGQNVAGAA